MNHSHKAQRSSNKLTDIKSRLQFKTVNKSIHIVTTAIQDNDLQLCRSYAALRTQYDRLSQQQLLSNVWYRRKYSGVICNASVKWFGYCRLEQDYRIWPTSSCREGSSISDDRIIFMLFRFSRSYCYTVWLAICIHLSVRLNRIVRTSRS